MTVHRTVILFRLTLRCAAGELYRHGGSSTGGDDPATLRVNSVLLHYIPAASSKCLIRVGV